MPLSTKLSDRMKKGIRAAAAGRDISTRQASIMAGFNQNQLNRFLTGMTDMKVQTFETICVDGFGLDVDTVLDLGK